MFYYFWVNNTPNFLVHFQIIKKENTAHANVLGGVLGWGIKRGTMVIFQGYLNLI